ncbi:MAG: hypothetical protein JRH10_17385 [Deltaproteobacteria bacterium]|nr:hypothetical protein [Deltaproteobacteria bacterium]
MQSNQSRWLIALLTLAVVGAGCNEGSNNSNVTIQLESVGSGLSGGVTSNLNEFGSGKLSINVGGLAASSLYEIELGGLPLGNVTSGADGTARVFFQQAQSMLPIDPRGQRLVVSSGGQEVFGVVISGSGEPQGIRVEEKTILSKAAPSILGNAKARFRVDPDGRRRFEIEIQGAAAGTYSVFVDGLPNGTFDAPAGLGQIEYDTDLTEVGKRFLDFDPRVAAIDLVMNGAVVFSGPGEAQIPGMNVCTFSEDEVCLPETPAGAGGKAKVRVRAREDCDQDVRIQVEVPTGCDYDVIVDGVIRGTIATAFDLSEGLFKGEIEFDTDPDEPGEVLLDFEVVGATLEIVGSTDGAVLFASAGFDPGAGGNGGICATEENESPLFATSAAPLASGSARFRVRDDCDEDFRVEIEDVAEGSYDLLVGGVLRGSFTAAFDVVQGQVRGEIEFDSDPDDPGTLLLDFDPRGQTVEIVEFAGATVLIGLDAGGGSAPPATCGQDEIERPLLNSGLAPAAKGKARFRQRSDCDRELRVEIEDLPAGDYDVLVGGVVRGAITVAMVGSELEGEIEFDTNPDEPGEVLLDFEVLGHPIEVQSSAGTLLERTLP